jgi:hypothetical protein
MGRRVGDGVSEDMEPPEMRLHQLRLMFPRGARTFRNMEEGSI